MLWHWIIFSAFAILAVAEEFFRVKKKTIKRFCSFIICILIFLSSIRWNQKIADWNSYYFVYERLDIKSFLDLFQRQVWDFEFLFNMMTRMVKATVDDYVIVQFLMALITFGFFYSGTKYLYREQKLEGEIYSLGNSKMALTFLLAWATECMGLYAVRTSLAMSICIFAIRYIEKRDFKRFIIWMVIACGFHFAAIIFVPAYFIYRLNLNNKQILRILVGAIILGVIGAPNLIKMVGLLGGRFAHKAAGYNYNLGDSYFRIFNYSGFVILGKALANTILIVIICIFISKRLTYQKELVHRATGLINLYLFGAMVQVVLLPYNMAVARGVIFYINQQYFVLPLMISSFSRKKENKVIIFIALLVYATIKMFVLLNTSEEYNVFNTIFSR